MIIPDLNLLLFAHCDAFPLHEPARRWWSETLDEVADRDAERMGEIVACAQ